MSYIVLGSKPPAVNAFNFCNTYDILFTFCKSVEQKRKYWKQITDMFLDMFSTVLIVEKAFVFYTFFCEVQCYHVALDKTLSAKCHVRTQHWVFCWVLSALLALIIWQDDKFEVFAVLDLWFLRFLMFGMFEVVDLLGGLIFEDFWWLH